MKFRLLATACLVLLGSCNAINGPRGGPILMPLPNRSAEAQFERIKSLEGHWQWSEELAPDLKGMVCTYEVTAGGTAVLETLFPGDDFEMVSLYHLDGDQLILTHYGSTGNQPTMRAKAYATKPGQVTLPIDFQCIGGTNMGTESDGHMHRMSFLDIQGDDLLASWTFQIDRAPAGDRVFKLSRMDEVPGDDWLCSHCQTTELDRAIAEAEDLLRELQEDQDSLDEASEVAPESVEP